MQILPVEPIYYRKPARPLTDEEINITQVLHEIMTQDLIKTKAMRRVLDDFDKRLKNSKSKVPLTSRNGKSMVPTAYGNALDKEYKMQVREAKAAGRLPNNLHITRNREKGPDIILDKVAWDLTTVEEGKNHVYRDIVRYSGDWDYYFVLGY